MSEYKPESSGLSIVALGSFNPSIFQPLWFSTHNLIRPEEADNAKIEIIHQSAAVFSAEWLSVQVTQGSFTILTTDPTKSLPLRDVAIGTFKLLEHTPLSAFGFNSFAHFRAASEEGWHSFGHHFAPKDSWNEILTEPGLLNLAMEGQRQGCDGRIQIRIEPSTRIEHGIVIAVNQHHNLATSVDKRAASERADSNRAFLLGVSSQWDGFQSFANRAFRHLLSAPIPARKKPATKKKG